MYDTPIPEMMQALNDAVSSGKVTYIGISDTPAWIVSQANQYARDHNMRPFVAYQGQYSPLTRDMERDIIPMAIHEGMALVSWGVLGQGILTELEKEDGADDKNEVKTQNGEAAEGGRMKIALPPVKMQYLDALTAAVRSIVKTRGSKDKVTAADILIAYAIQKAPHTIPVIGCRSTKSLDSSVKALDVALTEEEMAKIDEACPLDVGWPRNFTAAPDVQGREIRGPQDLWGSRMDGIVVGGQGWGVRW
jgi:aryl-alcohol dehydrogenase-like predicted oxidoreductase